MPNILSERIAALRKERGLTQEQLGKLVGVSAQAVGKWEKGGAPDVELLPALAEKLGVSIDSLFGLDGAQRLDVEETVVNWVRSLPAQERMDRFCRLLWASIKSFLYPEIEMPRMDYLKNCRQLDGVPQIMYSKGRCGGGLFMDCHADDMSFVTLWPEPKEGYAAYFPPMENCRRLFTLLAKPGCLEILETLGRKKCGFFVPEIFAEELHLPAETVTKMLEELENMGVVWSIKLETRAGEVKAYKVCHPLTLVPLMMAARSFMETNNCYLYSYNDDIPLLRGEAWEKEEDKSNEKA